MYVTFSDLFLFVTMMVGVISLTVTLTNRKKK